MNISYFEAKIKVGLDELLGRALSCLTNINSPEFENCEIKGS